MSKEQVEVVALNREDVLKQVNSSIDQKDVSRLKSFMRALVQGHPNLRPTLAYLFRFENNLWFEVVSRYKEALDAGDRQVMSQIEGCLNVLVAHGLTIRFEEAYIDQALGPVVMSETNIMNKLIAGNVKTENPTILKGMDQYIYTLTSSNELHEYLRFMHSHYPQIKVRLKNSPGFKQKVNLLKKFWNDTESQQKKGTLLKRTVQEMAKQSKRNFEAVAGLGSNNLIYNFMAECACHHYPRETRVRLEGKIVAYVSENFSPEKPLRILSMGAGNLLQDYLLVVRLLSQGYQNIELVMVDSFFRKECQLGFSKLDKIAAEVSASFSKHYVADIDVLPEQFKTSGFHIINAIDFSDFLDFKGKPFVDMVAAKSLLIENGVLCLGYKGTNLLFNDKRLLDIELLPSHQQESQKVLQAVGTHAQFLKTKKQIKALLFSDNYPLEEWSTVLPWFAKNTDCKDFVFHVLVPNEVGFFGTRKNSPLESVTEEHITQFILGYLPGAEIKVHAHQSMRSLLDNTEENVDLLTLVYTSDIVQEVASLVRLIEQRFSAVPCKIFGDNILNALGRCVTPSAAQTPGGSVLTQGGGGSKPDAEPKKKCVVM